MQRIVPRFLLLAVAALFVRVASADMQLLYFMLDNPLAVEGGGTLSASDYSFAMVAFTDSDGENPTSSYLTLYGGGGTAQGQAVTSGSTDPLYVGLGDSPTGNILFEMWLESPEGSFERVAYSSASLSELDSYIVSSMAPGGAVPYVVSTVHAVPEPTSGLLVLLGAAVLALRRKGFRI